MTTRTQRGLLSTKVRTDHRRVLDALDAAAASSARLRRFEKDLAKHLEAEHALAPDLPCFADHDHAEEHAVLSFLASRAAGHRTPLARRACVRVLRAQLQHYFDSEERVVEATEKRLADDVVTQLRARYTRAQR